MQQAGPPPSHRTGTFQGQPFHLELVSAQRTAPQVPCATVTTSFPRPRLSLTSPVYAAEA
jgi:hypothetical protein